jgi:hypothetical protein
MQLFDLTDMVTAVQLLQQAVAAWNGTAATVRYGREALLLLWVCGVYTAQAVVTIVLYAGWVCLQHSHAKQSCWFRQLLSWFLGLVVWCRTPSRYQRSAVPCGYVTARHKSVEYVLAILTACKIVPYPPSDECSANSGGMAR